MERLRSFIRSAFSYPRLLLNSHPVTAVSIIAASVCFSVYSFIEVKYSYTDLKPWRTPLDTFLFISLAILFFSVFALAIESIGKRRCSKISIAVFAFFGLLASAMSLITSDLIENSRSRFLSAFLDARNSLGYVTVALYIGALMVISLLLAIYFSYSKNIRQKFNDHVMNASSNIFFTSIIYGVIQLGVLFLIVIVEVLLYNDAFDLLAPVIILINGLFFAPAVICALIGENEKANMFMQILVRYIMLTIALLAYVIIYIYILKLVITLSVPSNEVYAILTALFVISMFITYMSTTFENKGFLQKFAYNAPLIFSPFIIMQCYTVIVRIGQYGLTPKRYFGIAFICFEIIYIAYYTYMQRCEKEIAGRGVLLIICAMLIITVFIPGINARSLSTSIAKRTLASYIDKISDGAGITDKEYRHANAAMGFLRDSDFGADRFEKYFAGFDDEMRNDLKEKALGAAGKDSGRGSDDYDLYVPKSSWYNEDLSNMAQNGAIDISGYDTIKYVRITDGHDSVDNSNSPSDASALDVYNTADGFDEVPLMTADLSSYCRDFIRLSIDRDDNAISFDKFENSVRDMNSIDINENARLYITQADIARNNKGEAVYIEIYGYLLERK